MKRLSPSLLMTFVATGWLVAPAGAQDVFARSAPPKAATSRDLANGTSQFAAPLTTLRAQQGSMRLNGASAREDLSFALAPQADIKSVRLVLRHATSRAQASTSAHLRLSLNSQFAAQLDAATGLTGAMDSVSIVGGFKPGFNTLGFEAVQRYTFDCQDPTADELWTEIDTERSSLEVSYQRRKFAWTLADLDRFLSPGVGGVEHLTIVTAAGEPRRAQLTWGALSAQAVTNRLSFKLPEISHASARAVSSSVTGSPAPRLALANRDTDVIIVGTFAEVGALLAIDPRTVDKEEGYLAVGPSPLDPTHFVIVASGHTDEAVTRAVLALGVTGFPLADATSMQISEQDAPRGFALSAHGPLRTGATYTFEQLGLASKSTVGEESAAFDLSFELPADFFAREKDEIILSLDFAYGAGLEPGSVLNLFVNGIFRRAVALARTDGEAASGYELRLPARNFRPGRNTVRLSAELARVQAGACATRNNRNLAFVLDGSSMIQVPNSPSYAELPNLALLSETGFPFSAASTAPFAIRAADHRSETLAAVWTLAAKLGQTHGALFSGIDFDFGAEPAKIHTLIVGARPAVRNLIDGPIRLALNDPKFPDDMSGAHLVRLRQLSDLGSSGLIASAENASHRGQLVTVVTAQTSEALLSSVRHLVEPTHWSQLRGSAAVWREDPSTVSVQPVGKSFFSGDASSANRVALQNGQSPWRWVLTLGGLIFAVAVVLAGIAHYMRRRNRAQ